MWRSVFLHEFLGMDMGNYQAVPGLFSVSPSAPPCAGTSTFLLPASSPESSFASSWRRLDNVIGLADAH